MGTSCPLSAFRSGTTNRCSEHLGISVQNGDRARLLTGCGSHGYKAAGFVTFTVFNRDQCCADTSVTSAAHLRPMPGPQEFTLNRSKPFTALHPLSLLLLFFNKMKLSVKKKVTSAGEHVVKPLCTLVGIMVQPLRKRVWRSLRH